MATTTVKTVPLETPAVKQGDQYRIPVTLYFNGEPITGAVLALMDTIEFAFSDELEPVTIPAAEAYNAALGAFLLPVTQAQTFALEEGRTDLDVRVKFVTGDVLGARKKARVKILDATSEEVI